MNKAHYRLGDGDVQRMVTHLQYLSTDDRDTYVRMSWSDLHGIVRGITVPDRHAHSFLCNGYSGFAGSITFGPASEANDDIFHGMLERNGVENCLFVPGSKQIFDLTWLDDTKGHTSEIICNAVWQDGSPFKGLPRNVLLQQVDRLSQMGYVLKSAFESEFMLLCSDSLQPIHEGTDYASHQKLNDHITWFYDLDQKLLCSGVNIRNIHAEYLPCQYEMTFMPEEAMTTADNMAIFKQALKATAKKNNYSATFMSWPFKTGGNGFHFNHSLWTDKGRTNAFWDALKDNKLSDIGRYWTGGILKHFPALTAICCPTINCYRRLHTPCIPSRPNWGIDDRNRALRIVNLDQGSMRIEHRLPSAASNPYLVTAACIAAGIDGIQNKIEPPPMGPNSDAIDLPHTLAEALKELESDDVIVNALGKEFVDMFVALKREVEVKKFGHHDMRKYIAEETEAERKEYLENM